MGTFKEDNGKTRIGVFLKNYAPDLLNVAGDLTGIKALGALGDAIKGTSELSEVQKQEALELLRLDIEFEKEITKRHSIDMASDSWLSKNIRPLALIYLLTMVTFLAFFDSAKENFNVPEGYISLVTQLLIIVFGFYFVGREIQKGIINYKKK